MKYSIRPFVMEDCEAVARNADNINIWNNVRDRMPHPYTLDDARAFITSVQTDDHSPAMAIIIADSVVGMISVKRGEDVERISGEVGYWLGESYWGGGIMTNVVREFCNYIFANTDMIHLFATVAHYNPASMRVLEKAGFSKVGIRHSAAIKNNILVDIHIYELVK